MNPPETLDDKVNRLMKAWHELLDIKDRKIRELEFEVERRKAEVYQLRAHNFDFEGKK